MLVIIIPLIVFLSSISPSIVTSIVKLLRPSETPAQASLRAQIREQRAQLHSMNMVDEFASYARVERKLNKLQAELNAIASQNRTNELKLRLMVTSISYCITGVSMLYVMLFYGSAPVLRLPAAALFPLGYLLAMPGCPSGCVSATTWVLISGSVVRRAVSAVTGR
ncbi:Tail-anchored protein insertion receptor WRB [Amphibalanus amphitrite]|uniref:Guided entry of tail-anchored proteins factor 1 n=1 Tax=Amphibalanus amphitrite TaxID=1232801 RepID=A0A6A4W5F2_AMPAM|nr:guided entry of tail-anchored proteins factor 1-like isoform X2 [Amphibalanus amphitrite]XP_043230486.1 guided entry of tail-anchored proteins factor 1-like isoform X2 [Amphibalanus amphitrite]KAF0298992.1 Tail-anchored protein insertion receptor WRB [Amphibalanus amphitrite]KAF0298994.1 Tail-anchored protein insertion receptor WRB [Amphibalanus amphitrite]